MRLAGNISAINFNDIYYCEQAFLKTEKPMTDLNENHKKNLLIKFRHVDKLLSEFACILDVIIPRSPLQQYVNDVNPDLRMIIEKHCNLVRQAMCRILGEKGIPVGKPDRSVLNQINVTVMFADMAIEELRPQYMKGYGKLSDAAAVELNTIATELKGLLKQIKATLPE
jgi:hypothetical protein